MIVSMSDWHYGREIPLEGEYGFVCCRVWIVFAISDSESIISDLFANN